VEAVRAGAMRWRRKEETERADGWARFLQGQRRLFMWCGVLETKIKEWSVLCTISKSGVCCAQNHHLGMCHRPISQTNFTISEVSCKFSVKYFSIYFLFGFIIFC